MERRKQMQGLAGVVLMGTLLSAGIITAQRGEVAWDVRRSLSTADQRAILELAAKAGISDPQRVSEGIRSECALLAVSSTPTVEGKRVVTNFVHVLQRNGPGCNADAERLTGRYTESSGNWVVVYGPSNPTQFESWRLTDGTWHMDLALPPDVPYEVAHAVVMALRQRTIVDLQPERFRRPLSSIDPRDITAISRDKGVVGVITVVPPVPDGYEVRIGRSGGFLLSVIVRNGRVELHAVRDWIS
jgi:hypothetical protein